MGTIYRVTVTVGAVTADELLLGVAFNASTSKFVLLLVGVDDNLSVPRQVAFDSVSKLVVRGVYG